MDRTSKKIIYTALLVIIPVVTLAQASGGQITRKPQVSRQTYSTRTKKSVDNQELKKYWEDRCKNVTSTQLEGERDVVKVDFDNFIYSFGNALLDENKKATLRYMLDSIKKEMNDDFHLIIWGYRDPQEPDYISYERAYRVYESKVLKNFKLEKFVVVVQIMDMTSLRKEEGKNAEQYQYIFLYS